MKILVPFKRVVENGAKPKPNADGSAADTSPFKMEMNWFDQIALEEAVRLREGGIDAEIVVVTVGTTADEEAFGKALAMGADRAVLLETSSSLDARGVAKALVAYVRDEAPDLVLMGKLATDADENQIAGRLAALLGWPQATCAAKITLDAGKVTVVRETDDGEETVSMNLPAVVSADLRLNEPRYLPIPAIIKAKNKPRSRQPAAEAPALGVRSTGVRKPPDRGAGQRVGTAKELFDALVAQGAL